MFRRYINISLIVFSALLPLQAAKAIDPLTTAELASHCSFYAKEPTGIDAVFCIRYIQGFIDGAVATDDKVAQNAINASSENETFSERAIRLRKARTRQKDPTFYADFCLGVDKPLQSVVENIILNLNQRKFLPKELPARDAVYQALRKQYPCN